MSTVMRSLNRRIGALAVLFGLLLAATTASALAASEGIDSRILQRVVDQMNASLPMMVDGDTRLERVSAGDGRFHYHYTVVTYAASELDVDVFRDAMTEQLQTDICNSPSTQRFLERGLTLVYEYQDKDGDHLADIALPPSACCY